MPRSYEVHAEDLTVSFYTDGNLEGGVEIEHDGSDDPDLPLYDHGQRWIETGTFPGYPGPKTTDTTPRILANDNGRDATWIGVDTGDRDEVGTPDEIARIADAVCFNQYGKVVGQYPHIWVTVDKTQPADADQLADYLGQVSEWWDATEQDPPEGQGRARHQPPPGRPDRTPPAGHRGRAMTDTDTRLPVTPEPVYFAAWDAAERTLTAMADDLGGKRAHATLAAAKILAAHHGLSGIDGLRAVRDEASEVTRLAADSLAERAALVRDYPDLFI